MGKYQWCFLLVSIALVSWFGQAKTVRATTYNVACSANDLIAAIEAANASLEDDTINLEAGCLYSLTVINNTTSGANGLPVILDAATAGALTINGNGATITVHGFQVFLPMIVNAGAAGTLIPNSNNGVTEPGVADSGLNFRILLIAGGGNLTLDDVTLQSGNLPHYGGAIFNEGDLTVNNSTLSGNSANFGGAIYNTGTLTVSNSTFTGNTAADAGGGINSTGALTMTDSTFSGNAAGLGGNILIAEGTAALNNNDIAGDPPHTCLTSPFTIPAGNTAVLNAAIRCANSRPSNDVINLTNSSYTLTAVNNDDAGPTGLPIIAEAAIAGTLTLNGNGATIERSTAGSTPDFRLLTITGGNLTLDSVTVQNGNLPAHIAGGIANFGGTLTLTNTVIANNTSGSNGGGIWSGGTLTVTNSTVSGNVGQYGAGIVNFGGTMTVINSTFSNNVGSGDGGGINSAGSLLVTDSTFSGNAAYLGGGILAGEGTVSVSNSTFSGNSTSGMAGGAGIMIVSATVTVNDSTFSDNSASAGGGLFNAGTLIMTNSTVTNNTAFNGGGIWNGSTMTVTHSTVSGNSAVNEGGGFALYGGTLNLGSTIVAGNNANSAGPDIFGTVNSLGYNAIGSTGGATITGDTTGNLTDAAAAPLNLGPLQDNGGPTLTMALEAGSVAINAGDPTFAPPPDFDQRGTGFPRVVGGRIDIGAYER